MLHKVSLKTKLVSAFMLTASLVLVVGYFNLRTIDSVHAAFADIVDSHLPQLISLQNIRVLAAQARSETIAYQAEQSPGTATAEAQKNQLLASIENLTDEEQAYLTLVNQTTGAERTTTLADFKPVSEARNRTVAATLALVSLKEQRAAPAAVAAQERELIKAESDLENALVVAIERDRSTIKAQDDIADQAIHQSIRTAALLVGLAAAFALLLGLAISISITRRLKRVQEGATRIASGDFGRAIRVQSQDEVGQLATSFNSMSERLRDSYRRLEVERRRDEAILQSMSEGLIAIDDLTNIILINDRAIELLELPGREKLAGLPVNHVFTIYDEHDALISAPETPAVAALKSMQTTSGVFGFHKKAGGKILLNIGANPVVVNEKVAGAIMILRDVTKEKEIDRMKTEFISLASHQLRTPLSAIKWFDEMLVSGDAGPLQPEQLDFAKNIGDSTERMIALVNALLNISRIESGRIMVDPKPTDLKELVAGIVNDLKAKTTERRQNLVISVHQDLPKINLDPRLIGQVYLNLLTNAIKYTPKGGEISVFISKKDDMVISQVTDNGYGIPKEQQGRIFQKFFRAANAVKVETDGTGLGLYLIKTVIESSGGKIWFESEEGKGTTFWFSIPLSGMKAKQGEVTLDV